MSGLARRTTITLLLVLSMVLAGCTGAGNSDDGGSLDVYHAGGEATVAESGGSGGKDASTGAASAAGAVAIQSRQLIRTGTVRVRVDSYDATAGALRGAAESMGGFVSDSGQRVHGRGNETWTTGRIVFRIPKERFDDFVARAKRSGEVQTVETNTEDVTDQLVDIGARLENLRAERERLRELYERANETEAILEVGERLSEVQGEIERLEARQQSLRQQVAYSTVTVEIRERPPEYTPMEHRSWYETGVLAAFLESVGGVFVVLRALVVGLAYAAPYLLVFGLPVAGLAALGRRFLPS